jgi:hypothetical protein
MQEIIAKAKKQLKDASSLEARDLALRTMIPLFEAMQKQIEDMVSNVDANFSDLYATLNLSSEDVFLDNTQNLVMELNAFIDAILLAAGFLKPHPESLGFLPTEKLPPEIQEKLQDLANKGQVWFAQLEAIRDAIDDDDDEDDDDDDFDDEDGEPSVGLSDLESVAASSDDEVTSNETMPAPRSPRARL